MIKYPSLQELLEAGVHFGHKISRGNPRMKPFIYGARDGVSIIDLTLSEKYLKEACEYVLELGKNNGTLLFVGTKKQAQPIIKELSQKLEAPYLTSRWIGGFLTNFEEISKNIKKLKELREAKNTGELKKYTKKEQLLIDRRMTQLERDLSGVLDLGKLPDAIFVVDAARDSGALKEARSVGVKVVAIADSNSDPSFMDYPIPGNDDAIKSIKILVNTIASVYGEGKKSHFAKSSRDEKASSFAKASEDKERVLEEEVAEAEEKVEKETVKDFERKIE